jgi:excisionase family DNA binding protein
MLRPKSKTPKPRSRAKPAAPTKRLPNIKRDLLSSAATVQTGTIESTSIRRDDQPPPGAMVLTIDQTAAAMQCSRPIVYERIRKGDIKAYRVGEVIRIDPESVRQFLFSRPIPATDGSKLAG